MPGAIGVPLGDDRRAGNLHVLRVALGDPLHGQLRQTRAAISDADRRRQNRQVTPTGHRVIVPLLDDGVLITDHVPLARLADHLLQHSAGAFVPVLGAELGAEDLAAVPAELGAGPVPAFPMPHVAALPGAQGAVEELPVLERLIELRGREVVPREPQWCTVPFVQACARFLAGHLVEVERELPLDVFCHDPALPLEGRYATRGQRTDEPVGRSRASLCQPGLVECDLGDTS